MNTHTELRERRHALLFTVEQGCRRQGIRDWQTLRRYQLCSARRPRCGQSGINARALSSTALALIHTGHAHR